jgi:adenosylcobinamide-GDP ribazoletransferase
MKPLLAALRFLTIVPIPGTWGTDRADIARSVPYFAPLGLVLGGVAAGVAWTLSLVAPPMVAAVALVLLLLTFSGCLHLDGLSDTADGFLSSRSRERILEIMKDSHVGAMGVIVIVGLLLTKFAALASIPAARLWPAVLLMPLAGRAAIVVHLAVLPCARPDGLGSVFYEHRLWPAAVFSALLLAAVAAGLLGSVGLAICGLWLAVTLALAAYVRRKIGGTTGDTLGAVCEILEVVPALAVAVWPLSPVR